MKTKSEKFLVLFIFFSLLGIAAKSNHLLGGEIRYKTIDSSKGIYEIEIILDRYCNKPSLLNQVSIGYLHFANGTYSVAQTYADLSNKTYLNTPCGSNTSPCTNTNANKIERNSYKTTLFIENSNKECVVFFEGATRSYSNNALNMEENILLYLSFIPQYKNTNTKVEEIQRHYLINNQLNSIQYAYNDIDMDSNTIEISRPYKKLNYTITGGTLTYNLSKINLQSGLSDAKPLYVSESEIQYNQNKILLTPNTTQNSWITLTKSEFRKISLGTKDTHVCISKSNIERLFSSANFNSQIEIDTVISNSLNAKVKNNNVTLCNDGNSIQLHYFFPVEKSIALSNYTLSIDDKLNTHFTISQRLTGTVMDTIQITLYYNPINIDKIRNLEFNFELCLSSTEKFTKLFTSTIEEYFNKVFFTDTILSCGNFLQIPLATKKAVNFNYGNRITNSPLDILNFSNPKDTLIIGIINQSHATCPFMDSIFINQGSIFSTLITVKNPLCFGKNDGEVKATAVGTNSPFSFLWSNGSQLDSLTNVLQGSYTLTVSDKDNCKRIDTFTVNAPRGIDATWNIDQPISCFGANDGKGHFKITNGGINPTTYEWTHNASINDSFLSNMNSGIYNGNYYYTNIIGNKCVQPFSIFMPQPDSLNFEFIINDNACHGESKGKIGILPQGGNGVYNYLFNDSFNSIGLFTNLKNGLYKIRVKDYKGCTSIEKFVTIKSPNNLSLNIQKQHPSCPESSDGGLTISNTSGGTSPYLYKIKNNEFNSDFSISKLNIGSYLLKITDNNLCVFDTNIQLIPQYILNVKIDSLLDSKCPMSRSGKIALTMTNGSAPFNYLFEGNLTNTSSPKYFKNNLLKGIYQLTIKDKNLCQWDTTFDINEPDSFKVKNILKIPTCYNGTDGSIALEINGGTPPYSAIQCFNSDNTLLPNSSNLSPGKYTLLFSDRRNCVVKNEYTIGNKPEFSTNIFVNNSIKCHGDKTGDIETVTNGGASPYTYKWNSNPSLNTPKLKGISAGTYEIEVTDFLNCKALKRMELTEPPKLKYEEIKIEMADCISASGGKISISASGGTISSDNSYLYSINGGLDYRKSQSFKDLKTGIYNLRIKDLFQCISDSFIELKDGKKLAVSLQPKYQIEIGDNQFLNPTINYINNTSFSDIKNIVWIPSYGLSCIDCIAPTVSPFHTQNYTLRISYANNCIEEAQTLIEVSKPHDLYIPNSFSPNGDGNNDEWLIFGKNLVSIQIFIYTKRGELVYKSNDVKKGWNGYYRGELARIDAYTYMIKSEFLDGTKKQYTGILNLIQ